MNIRHWALLALALIGSMAPAARGGVYLTSYTFNSANLPVIYTDESLPSPYRLRAKIEGNYHATDLWNNNSTQLQSVPGPGTYNVDLYWVKYSPDFSSLIEGPKTTQVITIQSSSNSPPSIQWTSAPADVQEGQSYYVQALGSDPNGNLNQVNVWKQWSPFGFAGGGDGSNGYSGNSSTDTGGQWITYQAQAVDSSGATSPIIYHTVHINKKPTIWWEIAPSTVNYQTPYTIRAHAQDADGNLTTINVYRTRDGTEVPFAFERIGSPSDAYSGNPDFASTYSTTLYRAEAIDSTDASSGSIYHTVYVANTGPAAAWSTAMPNTSVLPSGAVRIDTFIGQSYTFTVSASDNENNLQQVRTYEYAWEDVSGNWVERQHYQPFDTVASSGGPINRSYTHVGGKPWKWNYQYVALARDVAGYEDIPVSDNLLFVFLDNRNPAPPTLVGAQSNIAIGQTVTLSGAGSDLDQNATQQWLWYRGPDQAPEEWIHLTTSAYAGGTGNTVVNFNFTPQKSGTYYFKTQVNDPYNAQVIVDVAAVSVTGDVTPPNAPTNLTLTGITPTWAALAWTISSSADVAAQRLYWQSTSGGAVTDVLLGINVAGTSVTNLSPGNSYRVFLKATDGSGNSSDPSNEIVVTTPVPPAIVASPQNQTLNVGQTATFTVGVTGSSPLTYQWQKNGVNLASAGNVSGANSAMLILTNVQPGDAASYRVVVSNSGGGVVSGAASLTVLLSAPAIIAHPVSQTIAVGQTASFSVSVVGSSPFGYQWYKNGVAISGAVAAAYIIANAQSGDAANNPGYSVVVSNSVGSVASTPAMLTITGSGQSHVIAANVSNFNAASAFGNPTVSGNFTVTINPGVIVGSSDPAVPAFATGGLPAGSTLQVINRGRIQGAGGIGGQGGDGYNNGEAGQVGGDALSLTLNVTIDNLGGEIWGGAGGGGGSGAYWNGDGNTSGSGGGGGAGTSAGAGGMNRTNVTHPYTGQVGTVGTTMAGGNGGQTEWVHLGGNGGAPGLPGTGGSVGNVDYSAGHYTVGGAGGGAGYAVRGNSYSATWIGGGEFPNVKGSNDAVGGVAGSTTIASSVNNLNAASALGNPTTPGNFLITIDPGVTIGSTSPAAPAFTTGGLPAGSTLRIINHGRVQGAGGTGGQGGDGYNNGEAGQGGGDALQLTVNVTIDNLGGEIWGGGGGGGGSGAYWNGDGNTSGSGGGGGAGTAGGAGGTNRTNVNHPYTGQTGAVGTALAGGNGGQTDWAHTGGNGGAPGMPGTNGSPGNVAYSGGNYTQGGTGGAVGYAIRANTYSIVWAGGAESPNVKGSIDTGTVITGSVQLLIHRP